MRLLFARSNCCREGKTGPLREFPHCAGSVPLRLLLFSFKACKLANAPTVPHAAGREPEEDGIVRSFPGKAQM